MSWEEPNPVMSSATVLYECSGIYAAAILPGYVVAYFESAHPCKSGRKKKC